MFELKKYRGVMFDGTEMALNIDAKFKGKLTCASKNDMRKLKNFDWSALFDGLFLTEIYNI